MAGILSYALKLDTGAFTGAMSSATAAMRGAGGAASSLAGAIAKIAAPVAALAGGFSAWKVLEKAADMETLRVGFTTLLGSATAANDMLKEITATAASTPYGIEELATSAKSLLAVTDRNGITATLRMIGDLASAAQKPITDLASMYAKIKGGDVVRAEDLNQISDALPGALAEFVKVLKVDSVAAVRKLGEEGLITGRTLDEVFTNLTAKGGMAFGAMESQSQTMKGLLSTLKDGVDALMVAIGTPVNDFLKPIITDNIARLDTLNTQVKGFLSLLSGAGAQGGLMEFIGVSLKLAMIDAGNVFANAIRGTTAYLGSALPNVFRLAAHELTSDRTQSFFISLFRGIGDILRSSLESAASSIFKGLGRSGVASDLAAASRQSDQRASLYLGIAASAMGGLDWGKTARELADATRAINYIAKGAADAANKTPFFSRDETFQQWLKTANGINPEAAADVVSPNRDRGMDFTFKGAIGPAIDDAKMAAAPVGAQLQADLKAFKDFKNEERAWAADTKLLEAHATGRRKIIALAEREAAIEKYKLELMDKQGMSAEQAAKAAVARVNLEERAANPRRQKGLLDAAASAAARAERQALRDLKTDSRGQYLNPAAAARQLAKAAADPERKRREAAADAAAKAAADAAKDRAEQGKNIAGIFGILRDNLARA